MGKVVLGTVVDFPDKKLGRLKGGAMCTFASCAALLLHSCCHFKGQVLSNGFINLDVRYEARGRSQD